MHDSQRLKVIYCLDDLLNDRDRLDFGYFVPGPHILVQVDTLEEFHDQIVVSFGGEDLLKFGDARVIQDGEDLAFIAE